MKGWLEKLTDPERSIYERRYNILTAVSNVLFYFWILSGAVLFFHPLKTGFYLACAIMESINFFRSQGESAAKQKFVRVSGSVFFVFVFVPFGFLFGGGVYGGAYNWSMMALMYCFLTLEPEIRRVFLVLSAVSTAVSVWLSFRVPWVITYSPAENYFDSAALFVIAAVMLGCMFVFQMYVSRQEQNLLKQNRKEIDFLHKERVQTKYSAVMTGGRDGAAPDAAKRILITADSAADLPGEWISLYGIRVIHHVLHTDSGSFYDNREIDGDELMYYMRDEGHAAKSEVPSTEDFERFFAENLAGAEQIIHISIAKDSSPVFVHAAEAASRFDRVQVLDTGSMSAGAGLVALYAAYLAQTTIDAEELFARLVRVKKQITARFILENTAFLLRGKRIAPFSSRLMDAFLLRPTIHMKNDRMLFSVSFSTRYRRNFVHHVLRGKRRIDTSLLFITHAGLTERELKQIREETERIVKFDRVVIMPTSGAIAVNVGPGTFGLMFHTLSDDRETGGRLYDFLPE